MVAKEGVKYSLYKPHIFGNRFSGFGKLRAYEGTKNVSVVTLLELDGLSAGLLARVLNVFIFECNRSNCPLLYRFLTSATGVACRTESHSEY